MTHPGNEIVVQDNTKVESCREDLMKESKIPKPFIFKGYKTEKDRIEDTVRNNRYLYNLPDDVDVKQKKKEKQNVLFASAGEKTLRNKLPKIIKDNIIYQPQMRFKPRTDLERVFDALTGNYFMSNEKEILNRQLKHLDLFDYKKPSDIYKSLLKEEKKEEEKAEKNEKDDKNNKYGAKVCGTSPNSKKDKKYLYVKPRYPWVRRTDLNIEAQGMLSDLHVKTHFKAAEEFAENKQKIQFRSPKIQRHKNKNKLSFDFTEKDDIVLSDSDSYESYSKNYNPLYKKNQPINVEPNSLQFLTELAFKSKEDKTEENQTSVHEDIIIHDHMKKLNLVDDNNVLIGNQLLHKGTQFDIIAKKVLNMCNVYHHKSKHNDTKLKKRNGKLMMTGGLSVRQFEKKFNLEY